MGPRCRARQGCPGEPHTPPALAGGVQLPGSPGVPGPRAKDRGLRRCACLHGEDGVAGPKPPGCVQGGGVTKMTSSLGFGAASDALAGTGGHLA